MNSNPFLRCKGQSETTDRRQDNKRRQIDNRRDNNSFTQNLSKSKHDQTDEIIVNDTLFPSLIPMTKENDKANNTSNFKDALNQKHETLTEDNNKPKIGWIQISRVNETQVIVDNSSHNIEKNEEIEDLNNAMNRAIQNLEQNWNKHRIIYDNIYGEGAYHDLHYLTPIYGSDLDSDDEFDDDGITDEYYDDFYQNNNIDNKFV